MDPNETLRQAREAYAHFVALDGADDIYAELDALGKVAEAFIALDDWLSMRGFKPDAWERS